MIKNNKISDKLFLFILNPFLSAISSLKNIRDGVSHRFLYLWFLVFGCAFCAVNEAADSFRYVEEFYVQSNYSWNYFIAEIQYWLTFEGNTKDIYTLCINYFVGQFTDNYHWTYLVYASIFGFFYIKSLKIFLKHESISNKRVFYLLLFIFCFSNPIFNINGVRFWTAAWIGVYVGLKLFVEDDKKKLPLLLLMPVIHGSSVIWVSLMALAYLTKHFQNVWIILYITSSFVSATSYLDILGNYSEYLPKFMQNQIWSYTESEMALERMSGKTEYGAAYANFLISLPSYFQILLSILLIFNREKINHNKKARNLMTIMLALAAMTNFLSGIPSVGRFKALVVPFLVIVWAQNYNILKKYNKVFYAVPVLYAYSLLYWYRHMSGVTEIYLYILPAPITMINYLFL